MQKRPAFPTPQLQICLIETTRQRCQFFDAQRFDTYLVNVILLWEIVNLLRNRYVVGQFQRIEEDFVKRLEVSLYYGCARGTLPTLEAVCRAFGITLAQFFADEVDPAQLTDEQRTLFARWSSLTERQKNLLLDLMETM